MRNMNIFLGAVSNFASNIISSVLGFISRTVFIYYLGTEYLGYSGLLNNIFGFLSIAELGIGTAITFSLYEPLAIKDYRKISILMTLYKKLYYIIACIILIVGLLLMPFLDFFINSSQIPNNMELIYLLFLMNIVINYFFSYKTALLGADQKNYKIVHIQIIGNIVTILCQIISLILFKNYIIYLIVQIVFSNLSLVLQSKYVTKMYPEVIFNCKNKIDIKEKRKIQKNVKSLLILKFGDICVNSTDNLIISKFIDLSMVGIYSNYILIRDMINGYIKSIFSNMTASFGNLIVSESKEKQLKMFENLMFLSFWIYGFEAVCLFVLYNPFMKIWLNNNSFLLSNSVVFLIVLNNFLTGMRIPLITMKSAAGFYYEDRAIPFVFSIVNLIVSIILVKYIGISGVIIGTIVGSLSLADWYRPVIIYKKLFNQPVEKYFQKYIKYIIIALIEIFLTYQLANFQVSTSILIQFIFQLIVSIIMPNIINLILFYNSSEFIYLKKVVIDILKKMIEKVRR